MYKTKEIRWFFKQENTPILSWFNDQKINVFDQRKDFYLDVKNEDIGIKLREGNIELKHRIAERARGCLNPVVTGYFENWVKWSFAAKDKDPLYSQVLKGHHGQWIEITKQRLAVQLTNENDKLIASSQSQNVDYGCQVEYSKIHLMGEKWYTFGLEWFGGTCLELKTNILSQILGDTKLTIKQSMGYADFLTRNTKFK